MLEVAEEEMRGAFCLFGEDYCAQACLLALDDASSAVSPEWECAQSVLPCGSVSDQCTSEKAGAW